ncbi:uncharacterized protein LOC110807221 isoform X2 [Carica papaya]|uniref:uncharacterized protein LOC110807221 isoform X2 n=1 Tax=Carica papaya TaxID=3649 RepID=UPI000B8D067D|nr:uncharacterized protein LOC110807221 isoform X2 [Carica papaya]
MVVVQASKLNLTNPAFSLPSSSSPQISSLLFEPTSLSLALMHSDSSLSLYPSSSPLYISSLPPPQTLIPPPSSSSTFLLLRPQNPNPNLNPTNGSSPRVLFIVGGPHSGGSRVLLRFYALWRDNKGFTRARVVGNHRGIEFDQKLGVFLNVNHGISIKIAGSINFFTLYSVSSSKIWVFGVKLLDEGDTDGGVVTVKLIKCAVIECSRPVWSISVSCGFLIFGEENGVRVWSLRNLVKGKVRKMKSHISLNGKLEGKGMRLPNGVTMDSVHGRGSNSEIGSNGHLDSKTGKQGVSVKWRSAKYRQESSEGGSCFVAFKEEIVNLKSKTWPLMSLKAISTQALSPKQFLILDSAGDLHILHVANAVSGSSMTCSMRQLPHIMEVQKLVVLPEISLRAQTFWVMDAFYSLHMVALREGDAIVNENGGNEREEKPMQISVVQAIFAAEKIQDAVPIAGNGILILGQDDGHALVPDLLTFCSS